MGKPMWPMVWIESGCEYDADESRLTGIQCYRGTSQTRFSVMGITTPWLSIYSRRYRIAKRLVHAYARIAGVFSGA